MCATKGFTPGKCPKVLTRCWLPPMIYYTPSGHIRSHCTKLPQFTWTLSDIQSIRADLWQKLGNLDDLPDMDELTNLDAFTGFDEDGCVSCLEEME